MVVALKEDYQRALDNYMVYELKNPSAAENTVSGIRAKINSLVDFPEENE